MDGSGSYSSFSLPYRRIFFLDSSRGLGSCLTEESLDTPAVEAAVLGCCSCWAIAASVEWQSSILAQKACVPGLVTVGTLIIGTTSNRVSDGGGIGHMDLDISHQFNSSSLFVHFRQESFQLPMNLLALEPQREDESWEGKSVPPKQSW